MTSGATDCPANPRVSQRLEKSGSYALEASVGTPEDVPGVAVKGRITTSAVYEEWTRSGRPGVGWVRTSQQSNAEVQRRKETVNDRG